MSTLSAGAQIGPFVVEHPLGQGAHGEVWQARHATMAVPVALKLRPVGRDPGREDRALAAMLHPHIVYAYDVGQQDGWEWIAMELASGGTLDPRALPLSALGDLLRDLLSALAHAHARGVIHRDIKPSNILHFPGVGWKLSDFSAAYILGEEQAGTPSMGTPRYMAPEQRSGTSREHGPWTDLYALGCVVTEILTGQTPPGPGAPPPALPEGAVLSGWLQALLAREPHRRPPSAAAAAQALADLDLGSLQRQGPSSSAQAALLLTTETSHVPSRLPPARSPTPEALAPRLDWPQPQLPVSWMPTVPPARHALPGAGLSLLGFRPLPTVGRRAAQERLWTALQRVASAGRSVRVVLRGPVGSGRRHLARALLYRVGEAGAGAVWVRCDVPDGIHRALVGLLGAAGLDGEALDRQVVGRTALWGLSDAARGQVRAAVCGEVPPLPALARLVSALPGPVVVVLEGLEAVSPHRQAALLEGLEGCPALLVALAEALPEEDWPDQIPLPPLPPRAVRELLCAHLDLEVGLASQILAVAGGHPGSVAALVAALWADAVLVAGPDGHQIRPGARLPDLAAEGSPAGRVAQLTATLSDAARQGLWLAALLGEVVEEDVWQAACLAAGLWPPPREGLAQAAASRLLHHDPGAETWSFLHPAVRQVLGEQRDAAGWRVAGHRACAAALAGREDGRALVRRGWHLDAIGAREAALAALVEGAPALSAVGEAEDASTALERALELLDEIPVSRTDPRWQVAWVRALGIRVDAGEQAWAEAACRRLLADPETPPTSRSDAAVSLARIQGLRGELHAALALLDAEAALDPQPGRTALFRGWLLSALGDPAGALRVLEAALVHPAPPKLRAALLKEVAQLCIGRGELARAHDLAREALALPHGYPPVHADAWILLGDILVVEERFPEAQQAYEQAAALLPSQDASQLHVSAKRAEQCVLLGHPAEALALARAVLPRAQRLGRPQELLRAHLVAWTAVPEDALADSHLDAILHADPEELRGCGVILRLLVRWRLQQPDTSPHRQAQARTLLGL